ncbi:hypothetical protein H257_11494 [Aphanomyces astaci]|uniref:Uncharacterized protein n=1 Tax=Aphanomyces astaci TaxID=112090 RepID=W4G4D6_APHAT|nr:hypothetical protein H257_11494 [Aphanomyces astaci]ETV73823.1 hypothetical protein H257_11494 [Aphanomyces astaci]|eukprot:XP_009836759.1 hypothetical protein H257_11494 [Aphanomyces astaci]
MDDQFLAPDDCTATTVVQRFPHAATGIDAFTGISNKLPWATLFSLCLPVASRQCSTEQHVMRKQATFSLTLRWAVEVTGLQADRAVAMMEVTKVSIADVVVARDMKRTIVVRFAAARELRVGALQATRRRRRLLARGKCAPAFITLPVSPVNNLAMSVRWFPTRPLIEGSYYSLELYFRSKC